MLPPKGSAISLKKSLGALVGIAGVGLVAGIDAINNIVLGNQMIFGIVLLVVSYFLVISGRQL